MSVPDTSVVKVKRARNTASVSLAVGQNCIAASMAKIITRMVNANVQYNCMEMLQIQNLADAQGRILQILQHIDHGVMEEKERKENNKKQKKE